MRHRKTACFAARFGTLFCSNIASASCYFVVSLVSWTVKVHVVFLAGLRASGRMTACCACLGVGFIAILLSLLFFARASFRPDKQKSHLIVSKLARLKLMLLSHIFLDRKGMSSPAR